MCQSATGLLHRVRDRGVDFRGEFDGIQTVQDTCELMPPVGCVNHVIFNFSKILHISAIDIYYLLEKLIAEPRFKSINISIEGLPCRRMGNKE